MIQISRTKIFSFFVLILMFSFSFPSVQSDLEDGLYSHISEITIESPVCNSRYNYTYFYVNFVIELYSTMNEPFTISTPHSNLFVPKADVSLVNESYTYVFLYTWYAIPTDYLIPPNTSTYLRQYAFAFKIVDYCFTRLPEGNYTVWLELDGVSPIPYYSFSSTIYVNETDIEISHEPYDSTLFTIPEYFQIYTIYSILPLSLILIISVYYKKQKKLR